ncbi:MAG: excinuclease ABC subunit B [Pseudomonadota bacterium]
MRFALALIFVTPQAIAWEFSAAPICTLTESTPNGTMTVTYDASLPEYTITITLPDGRWPEAPGFAMAFAGDRPIGIQTDGHELSEDGRSLTVTDTGFGNVLNGLEFNMRAYATSGELTVEFGLAGIGPAMRDFRNCPDANLA